MPTVSVTVSTPFHKTARTVQVSSMFDYAPEDVQVNAWEHTLPIEEREWGVGLIVGPSGAGKTVLARELWPGEVLERFEWPDDVALVDVMPREHSVKHIAETFTAVGLGTVPAWTRPYRTLSNGEKFRADMARAILEHETASDAPIVVDEFTSVIDRQVARTASHAVQKAVRRAGQQFVAVTCHYDVEDWLQPDWVYDVAAQAFTWRSVQPHPPILLEVHEAPRAAWTVFARHHYLSASLVSSAKCFVATAEGAPVAFTSHRPFPHPYAKNIRMAHRTVVLPDWQGLGIAGRLREWMGDRVSAEGYRLRSTVAHPAMIALMLKSPRWRAVDGIKNERLRQDLHVSKARKTALGKVNYTHAGDRSFMRMQSNPRRLLTRSFEYQPAEPSETVS